MQIARQAIEIAHLKADITELRTEKQDLDEQLSDASDRA